MLVVLLFAKLRKKKWHILNFVLEVKKCTFV